MPPAHLVVSPTTPRSLSEFSALDPRLEEKRIRMKASKLTDAQQAFVVNQARFWTPVPKVCRS